MSQYTPGPWIQGSYNPEIVLCCSGGEELPICECDRRSVISEGEETQANARLIAAAPDLLHSLEWIVTDMTFAAPETFYERCCRWQHSAREAIAKATGEPR